MTFLTAWHSDPGIIKVINQDSLLIERADSHRGTILLASVCDGMGGLSRGELASGSMVRRLSEWFETRLPVLAAKRFSPASLKKSLDEAVCEANRTMTEYGHRHHISLGTTCTLLLILEDRYYILNAGDSRIYLKTDTLYQLTKDQSFVQREKDRGRMSSGQAANDFRKNILLECVGGEGEVHPDFFTGRIPSRAVFLICSDGFVHKLSPQEINDALDPAGLNTRDAMKRTLVQLTELCKERMERDNITSILIRTGETCYTSETFSTINTRSFPSSDREA